MVHLSPLLAGLVILQSATAVPTLAPLRARGGSLSPPAAQNAKAIYFISNTANNSVVALKVNADGTLSDGSMTPTGGVGMVGVDSSDGAQAATDGLFSQGCVKVAGNVLLAVNPGSNTLSMFTIDPWNPTSLSPVGTPAPTLGDFPVSVTISQKLNQACVANSGTNAGIACFYMTPHGLIPLDKAIRSLTLSPAQSNPPAGPLNTISQTFFNDDSSALLTTVKGNGANNTGYISAFPVQNGRVSTQDVRSSPNGTAVLFGVAPLPGQNDKIFMTDASFGATTVDVSRNLTASSLTHTAIDGQGATCWATFSSTTGTGFVTDVKVNRLVEIDPCTGAIVAEHDSQNGNAGMIDLEGKGDFVYALAPGNQTHVSVWDVSGGKGTAKEVQNFAVNGVGGSAQGMAFF